MVSFGLTKALINRATKHFSAADLVYGVSWDKSSNPTLTRTDAAVGMIANAGVDMQAVRNDFDYAQIYRDIHEVQDTLGNVFVRIPKLYIRKTDGVGFKTWQVSRKKYPGFYLPWCFWDFTNGRELPYIDVGKYKASLGTGSKLESKPDTYPLVDTNIVSMRTYARNNNVDGLSGYQQLDIHVVDLLQTLFYIEFATLDSQSVMRGWVDGRYAGTDRAVVAETGVNRIVVSNAAAANYSVGQPIAIGSSQSNASVCNARHITSIEDYDASNKAIYFDGDPVNIAVGNYLKNSSWRNGFSNAIAATSGSIVSNTDGKHPFIYRGIESLWGDLYQFVDGVNIDNHQTWVASNAEDYASNVFAHPYEQLGYVNSTSNGYVSEMGFDPNYPYAPLPVAIGGSASTYYADYYYQNTGQRIAHFGGDWNGGSNRGLSVWYLANSSSSTSVTIGGRLVKKPL